MDKFILITTLQMTRDQYLISCLAAGHLFNLNLDEVGRIDIIFRDPDTKNQCSLDVQHLKILLAHHEMNHLFFQNIGITLRKSLISSYYEQIMSYCKKTNQTEIFSKQSWYPFARVLRNVSSHQIDDRIIDWPKNYFDKGINEVSWRHKVIKKGMKGNDVKMSDIDTLDLVEEELQFVTTILK